MQSQRLEASGIPVSDLADLIRPLEKSLKKAAEYETTIVSRSLGYERISSYHQWIAAYMIFSSVASVTENSSTTLPCRETKMRSDSAMISGR